MSTLRLSGSIAGPSSWRVARGWSRRSARGANREHDWDWRSAAADTPEQLYAGWTDAVTRCRALMDEALADSTSTAAPRLRYILPNMIEEYARHNGHADLIRESVDGLVGHDPPE